MTFEALTSIAESKDIITFFDRLNSKKAFSICENKQAAIIIDTVQIETERERKRIYAEELGHCTTKAFYPFQYCAEPLKRCNIAKAEHKAQEASYILQVPFAELQEAIKKSSNDNEIAELLDVDIDTLHNAVECYQHKGLL
jgi:hypothetical protein